MRTSLVFFIEVIVDVFDNLVRRQPSRCDIALVNIEELADPFSHHKAPAEHKYEDDPLLPSEEEVLLALFIISELIKAPHVGRHKAELEDYQYY